LSGTQVASVSGMAVARTRVARRQQSTKPKPARRWSQHVTETSDALDLHGGVFKSRSARAIASSLKRSAERSKRRKASPYQSAMSMLNFYVNRAGKQLSAERKRVLERAKRELRVLFQRAE
jgi:hypothetical protein